MRVQTPRDDPTRPGQKVQTTALCLALAYKHEAAAGLLMERGADASLTNSVGATPLMCAAATGNLAGLQLLLARRVELDFVTSGSTAFHFACASGHTDVVEALVHAGCDTSLLSSEGQTGREMAVQQGHAAVVRAIDAGVAAVAGGGGAAAAAGALGGLQPEPEQPPAGVSVDVRITSTAAARELARASGGGVKAGTPIAIDGLVNSPHNGKLGFVERFDGAEGRYVVRVIGEAAAMSLKPANLLLNPSIQFEAGTVVLIVRLVGKRAQHNGKPGIVESFHKSGRYVVRLVGEKVPVTIKVKPINLLTNHIGCCRERVLQFAARRGDITAMRRLIDDGADPNELVPTPNSKGQFTGLQTSALILALNAKEEAAVRLLLERGADPSLADSGFITPLIAATICHNLAMVRLLLAWQAALDYVIPDNGLTAFHYACLHGHANVAEALVQADCDTTHRDDSGATGRDLAMRQGHAAVVRAIDHAEVVVSQDKAGKVRKKKAKRKSQLEQKKKAAEIAKAAVDIVVEEPEPEPAPEIVSLSDASTVQPQQSTFKSQKKTKKKKKKGKGISSPEQGPVGPGTIVEPKTWLYQLAEPEPEPETFRETEEERCAREREASTQILAVVPMSKWSEEQTREWAAQLQLPAKTLQQFEAFVAEEETDGEELENWIQKTLHKSLKKTKMFDNPIDVAEAVLAQRDRMLAMQVDSGGGEGVAATQQPLRVQFDRKDDLLGGGRFGKVFRCRLDGEDGFAVKRIQVLDASLVSKEIEVLTRARTTDEGGHPNVVKYFLKESDVDFVYICMELCDSETLDTRIRRMSAPEARLRAVRQLFSGVQYLHGLHIIHRDLKPTNILFKGSCLKICDMGQSRILVGGSTAVETGSGGGTLGWMTPEELAAKPGHLEPFTSRLSGDCHTAGSIAFFILTGGLHAFGSRSQNVHTVNGEWFEQQNNIRRGRINIKPLFDHGKYMTCAADLILRMTKLEPQQRPNIVQAVTHPALWDCETKVRQCCDWHKSWKWGSPALERRLKAHAGSVRQLVGDRPEGWLAKLQPAVLQQLTAGRHYNGRDLHELLRAIRNVEEHFFQPQTSQEEEVLEALAGQSVEEVRRGQATQQAAAKRAEVIERAFFSDGEQGFAELLLIFALPNGL
eukprot:COSAG01_NODE_5128_length_4469_cov_4.067506_2_plen_1140_part_00